MKQLRGLNVSRARWAVRSIEGYAKEPVVEETNIRTLLGDLFVDLRHFADERGINLEELWIEARQQHARESVLCINCGMYFDPSDEGTVDLCGSCIATQN